MPWKLKGKCVVKDNDTEDVVKCHDTEEAAQKHLSALQANYHPTKSDPRPSIIKPVLQGSQFPKSLKGGAGSGNFGHRGRPGAVGGSGSGGGIRIGSSGMDDDAAGEGTSLGEGGLSAKDKNNIDGIVSNIPDYIIQDAEGMDDDGIAELTQTFLSEGPSSPLPRLER